MSVTSPIRVLAVCTGNTCRSPMAEALLRARFEAQGIAAEVGSVGTLGWAQRPATEHAVAVMAERGLDISAHRSRRIDADSLDVDLVLAMTRDHAGAVIARDDDARGRVFLPGELSRLLRSIEGAGSARDRVVAAGTSRGTAIVGRPHEQVADPAGESIDVYRATAARLDRDLGALVDRLIVT